MKHIQLSHEILEQIENNLLTPVILESISKGMKI